MKKIFFLFFLFLAPFCFAANSLMVIKPFQEIFLNFPSAIVNDEELIITTFLPEEAVPLQKKYPVIYVLGLGSKDAEAVTKLLKSSVQKAIIVGVKWGKEIPQAEKASAFFSRELIPYVDSNYPTFDEPLFRAIVAFGEENTPKVMALLSKKNLFKRAALLNMGEKVFPLEGADPALRIFLAGSRGEVVAWQQATEQEGLGYGAGFVTKIGEMADWVSGINIDFLFAKAEDLTVKKLTAVVQPDVLSLQGDGKSFVKATAHLKNDMQFDYVPLSNFRLSPHYLNWNAQEGSLSIIHGAEKGKVKASFSVDNVAFKTKIRLKK